MITPKRPSSELPNRVQWGEWLRPVLLQTHIGVSWEQGGVSVRKSKIRVGIFGNESSLGKVEVCFGKQAKIPACYA